VQEDLAATLETLDKFYEGEFAARAPEPFAAGDLARHQAKWVTPEQETFAGLRVFELPPNSRGHLALAALRLLESLDGLSPADPEWHARIIRAVDAVLPDGDTVYLCVVDGSGMCVSLNQSLFMAFGSGVVVPGTGVLLHNRGAYHSEQTYRGGAVPVHTLAPAMALRGERPFLVFGTMGGEAQIQIHLQLLARIAVAKETVEEAIAAPRWVLQRDALLVEPGLPPMHDVLPGIDIQPIPSRDAAGHAHAIKVDADGLFAAADPRADGVPVGF
jgi:gamma-glutamyltranspeptidase/glutathione hydrolase